MTAYTLDAFTQTPFGGNAAGVVLLDGTPPEVREMQAEAARLGLSETAFIQPLPDGGFRLRYFTPTTEVELCGHATVASFQALRQWGLVRCGTVYTARTLVGDIAVDVGVDGCVWLDMAPPRELGALDGQNTAALYAMFGLTPADAGTLAPAIVNTGLPDIMMPVASRSRLSALRPDFTAIAAFSERLDVTGVHVFTQGEGVVTAYVRNFAPLVGIEEEAATGTSNGALSYYLYRRGLLQPDRVNLFIQGEDMGRPSEIRSRIIGGEPPTIRIGGFAVMRP